MLGQSENPVVGKYISYATNRVTFYMTIFKYVVIWPTLYNTMIYYLGQMIWPVLYRLYKTGCKT